MAKRKSSEPSKLSQNDSGDNGLGELFSDLVDFKDLGDIHIHKNYEPFRFISTGVLSLDYVLGAGKGIARGQVTQISGPPSAGKTSILMMIGANGIAQEMKVAVLPTEGRWNEEYGRNSGMGEPGKNYFMAETFTAEDALNTVVWLAEHEFDICLLDSVIGMPTKTQYLNELGKKEYAALAVVLSDFFKMRMSKIRGSNMALVVTNQLRTRMNVTYGDPNRRPGGNALEYYTSTGLHLDAPTQADIEYPEGSKDKDGKTKPDAEPIGMTITGKTWKNSLCSPLRRLELPIRFVSGRLAIDREGEIAEFGRRFEVFRAKNGNPVTGGSNWCYQGEVVGSSKTEVKDFLRENREAAQEIERAVRQAMIARG